MTRVMMAAVIAITVLVGVSTREADAQEGACFWDYWGSVVCAPDWFAAEVSAAADYHGADYNTLMAVAACESAFVLDLWGAAGEYGPFQWMPGTWDWIGWGDRFSAHNQAWSTAWAFANGYASLWVCAQLIGVA